MPLFEYQCADCQKEFELLIRGSEEPVCPVCGSKDVDKLLSASAISMASKSLPMAGGCDNTSGPPCGPACGRWPG